MNEEHARDFAADWIAAWNSHNPERIMEHYANDVVLISPAAARIMNDPSGEVAGRAALRAYFEKGLTLYPQLHFELIDVLWGLRSVVLYYRNQNGTKTAEFMEFGAEGKVTRALAHYAGG